MKKNAARREGALDVHMNVLVVARKAVGALLDDVKGRLSRSLERVATLETGPSAYAMGRRDLVSSMSAS